jgi:hypothetical protein
VHSSHARRSAPRHTIFAVTGKHIRTQRIDRDELKGL